MMVSCNSASMHAYDGVREKRRESNELYIRKDLKGGRKGMFARAHLSSATLLIDSGSLSILFT